MYLYKSLAQRLGSKYTVYGLQAHGLRVGDAPLDDVTRMAANYIQCVRAVQPQGPYHIGGSSFGGMLAFEIAQQLAEKGEKVDLLALFDSPCHVDPLGDDEILRRSFQYILGEKFEFPEALKGAKIEENVEYVKKSGKVPKSMDSQALQQFIKVWSANNRAMQTYTPHPYKGTLHYFKASAKSEIYPWVDKEAWKRYAEEARVEEVAGDHMSMLAEPNVSALASRLLALLNF